MKKEKQAALEYLLQVRKGVVVFTGSGGQKAVASLRAETEKGPLKPSRQGQMSTL